MKVRKVWRVVREVVDEVDIVVEVVDVCDFIGMRNRKFERLIFEEGKFLFIVMNKVDLVLKEWVEEYKRKSEVLVVFISVRERKGIGIFRKEIKKLVKLFLDEKEKVKVVFIGYFNVGKSMIINIFKGKRVVGIVLILGYIKGK